MRVIILLNPSTASAATTDPSTLTRRGRSAASAANFVIVLVRKRPLDCAAIPQAGLVEQHAGDGPEVVRRHLGFRITEPPECPIQSRF